MQVLGLIIGLVALEAVCGLSIAALPVVSVLWLLLPIAVFLLLRPEIAYLLVIAAAPIYGTTFGAPTRTGLGYGAIYPFHLAVAMMFGGCLVRLAVKPKRELIELPGMYLLLSLFIAVALATTLWAPNLSFGLFGWIKLFFYWMLVMVAVWLTDAQMEHDPNYLGKIVQAWVVSGLVMALAGILSDPLFYRMTHLPPLPLVKGLEEQKRAVGLSWHANILASHLNVCILLAISQFSPVLSRLKRTWLTAALAIMVLSLMLALSRSAIVALAAGLLFYVYLKEGLSRRLGILLGAGVLATALFLALTSLKGGGVLYYRYTTMVSPEVTEEQSMQARFTHWGFGWQRLVESYGLGLGPNGFGWLRALADPHYNKNIHPHNIYLSVLYDYGLIGFGLFASFIGALVMRLRRMARECQDEQTRSLLCALLAVMFCYGLHALLDFNLFDRKIWVFLAFALGAATVIKTEAKSVPEHAAPAAEPTGARLAA